jgi:hypothetical protein
MCSKKNYTYGRTTRKGLLLLYKLDKTHEQMNYIKQIMWKLLQDKPKLGSIPKRLRRSKDKKKLDKDL